MFILLYKFPKPIELHQVHFGSFCYMIVGDRKLLTLEYENSYCYYLLYIDDYWSRQQDCGRAVYTAERG